MTEMPEMPKPEMPKPETPEASKTILEVIRKLYEDTKPSLKKLYKDNKRSLARIVIHLGLYYLALIIAYSIFKEFSKGYDHVISHFIGTYLDTPELSRAARDSIKHAFPWAILIFAVFYSVAYSRKKREDIHLSPIEYLVIIALAGFSINLIFIFNPVVLATLNLSFVFFFILLFTMQTLALYPVKEYIEEAIWPTTKEYLQLDRLAGVSRYCNPYLETPLALQEKAESNRLLVFFASSSTLVLILYLSAAFMAYWPIMDNIFRNDHWLFLTLERSPGVTLTNIAFFEMFGHLRFETLRWLITYSKDSLLDNNILLHNMFSVAIHAVNGLIIYLISRILLKNNIPALLLGLLFVVLASQFNTVSWTQMFHLVAATLLNLLALLFIVRFICLDRSVSNLYLGLFLSATAVFIQESLVLIPLILLASFLVWFRYCSNNIRRQNLAKHRTLIICGVILFYFVFYFSATSLNLNVTTATMTASNIFTFSHLLKGASTTVVAMVNINLLNNIGIFPPHIEIYHLVFLSQPNMWHGKICFVLAAIFVAILWRSRNRTDWYFVYAILLMGMSFIMIVCIGRIFTGGFEYILSQSRYAYFPNAFFVIVLGLLLWPSGSREKKFIIYLSLLLLITFNFKNTYSFNTEVDKSMKMMDTHYSNIKSFLGQNPKASLFLNFIPHNSENRFSLGTDIAFDILFPGKITKSVKKATHIYDSNSFKKNENYSPDIEGTNLGDFTVEWLCSASPEYFKKEVALLGSGKSYPKISITPAGFIEIQMMHPEKGTLDPYAIPYPNMPLFRNDVGQSWVWIVIEKQGQELCFVINGFLEKKFQLDCDYMGWQKEGSNLLGSYYRGAGENVQFGRLFIMMDDCKYKCGEKEIGHKFDYDISTYYQ